MANPFAAILEQARHVFVSHDYPTAAARDRRLRPADDPDRRLRSRALVGGFLLFDREAPRVAEQL